MTLTWIKNVEKIFYHGRDFFPTVVRNGLNVGTPPGRPARHLALQGRHQAWLAWRQCTVSSYPVSGPEWVKCGYYSAWPSCQDRLARRQCTVSSYPVSGPESVKRGYSAWPSCQAPGVTGSAPGPVGPASVHCE